MHFSQYLLDTQICTERSKIIKNLEPEDEMDVESMAKCLKAIGDLSANYFDDYPLRHRHDPVRCAEMHELHVLCRVFKCMFNIVVEMGLNHTSH